MRLQNAIPEVTDKDYRRFWSKAVLTANPDKCWEWQRGINIGGYGTFDLRGRTFVAHRVAYFIANKVDPIGLCVCHKCDNPKCVNPSHLFLGTDKDNVQDMILKGRAHGHNANNFKNAEKPKGQKHGMSKLTEGDVVNIVDLYSKEGKTYKEISELYNVALTSIYSILKGRSWKHLGLTINIDKNEIKSGQSHYLAQLTEPQVIEIAAKYDGTKGAISKLSSQYEVSYTTIHGIVTGRTWKKTLAKQSNL